MIFDEGAMEIITIHFNVPGHHLPLETFIQTATNTKAVVAAFNDELFDGKLQYELLILPPEPGTFKSKLGILVVGGAIFWAFVESDMGKGIVRGLTGHDPGYWAEIAGQNIKQQLIGTSAASESGDDDDETERRIKCQAEAAVMAEVAKSFLQKDVEELKRVGVQPERFHDAYEARNNFYQACYDTREIEGIGFDETENFPIERSDFTRLRVALPPKEEEPDERPWRIEIAILKVTSPNWDREDKQRQWKGKDSNERERYFKIEDEHFWNLVKEKRLNPHIIDTMKVQWAFHEEHGRPKDARVLIVLEFNDEHLADPLDENALNALLGQYEHRTSEDAQGKLFDT